MLRMIVALIVGYVIGAYQTVDPSTNAARIFGLIKGIVEGMLQ